MQGGEDYLLRPVLRGLIKYESLIDGTLGLEDIALLHEALDVDSENRYRAQKVVQSGR